MPHHAPQPAPAESGTPDYGTLANMVQELLASEEVRAMPQDQQGRFIVDRWVGHMVALHGQDALKGSVSNPATPFEVLDQVAAAANVSNEAQWNKKLMGLTQSGGLRI